MGNIKDEVNMSSMVKLWLKHSARKGGYPWVGVKYAI